MSMYALKREDYLHQDKMSYKSYQIFAKPCSRSFRVIIKRYLESFLAHVNSIISSLLLSAFLSGVAKTASEP